MQLWAGNGKRISARFVLWGVVQIALTLATCNGGEGSVFHCSLMLFWTEYGRNWYNTDMYKKFIITIAVIIIVAIIITVIFFNTKKTPPPAVTDTPLENEIIDSTEQLESVQSENLPREPIKSLNQAWAVFDEYVSALNARDIPRIKDLSYQQSETCSNPDKEKECLLIIDNLTKFVQDIKKEDYINNSEDKSQVILSTSLRRDSIGRQEGVLRGYIYFARDQFSGSLKILAIDPNRGWFYQPKETDAKDFIEKKLLDMSKDSDEDGLTDFQESCLGSYFENTACTNTDQNKKDTDGDGWWDGIEFFFNENRKAILND